MKKAKKQPKKVTVAELFRIVAYGKIVVEREGCRATMTRWEAVARAVQDKALSGNVRAARLLSRMWKFPARPATERLTFIIYPEDLNL